jgi:hypothetical protein
MPNDNRHATHSDTEILDLIEDFLVNHFGVDDRQSVPEGAAFQMLEHIDALVGLRHHSSQRGGPGASRQEPRLTQDNARS